MRWWVAFELSTSGHVSLWDRFWILYMTHERFMLRAYQSICVLPVDFVVRDLIDFGSVIKGEMLLDEHDQSVLEVFR